MKRCATTGSAWPATHARRRNDAAAADLMARGITPSASRNDDAAALARHLEHQLVHAAHEPGGIVELPAFGEECLVEEQVPPVGEARLFLVQAPYHGMRRIDLEDRLHLRPLLADGLENAREIAPHVVLVGYEARRRSGEARGNAHVLHAVAERILQFRDERPVPARLLRFLLLLLVGLELGKVELAFRDRGERLALVFREIRDQPLVDALREQQHLDCALPEDLQVRAVLRGEEGLRDRKSTRLNSSHVEISYAVFCLKKKNGEVTEERRLGVPTW